MDWTQTAENVVNLAYRHLDEFFILLPHCRHKGLLSSQARAPSLRWGSRRARVPLRGKVTAMAAGPNFLTVAEVAAQMRVSKMTVYRLVHAGDLEAVRVGPIDGIRSCPVAMAKLPIRV